MLSFTLATAEAPIEKRFEYKGPPIHVKIHSPMVQPAAQYPNQGYHPRILLAYPGASYPTTVALQYAYAGAPYVPFGVHYGQTSHQIVNPGLAHSAQMFQPMVIPQIHSQYQILLVPMSS